MRNTGIDEALIKLCGLEFPGMTAKGAIQAGDLLLSGKLVTGKGFEPLDYDEHNIDWDIVATASPTTYSMYLHMLTPVYNLAYAYYSSGNEAYLDRALQIIMSWMKYEKETEKHNHYTWYDHAVSGRTSTFAFLAMLQVSKKGMAEPDAWLIEELYKHGQWLMSEKKYKFNQPWHYDGYFVNYCRRVS